MSGVGSHTYIYFTRALAVVVVSVVVDSVVVVVVVVGVEVVADVVEVTFGDCAPMSAGFVTGGGSTGCAGVAVAAVGAILVVAGVCDSGDVVGVAVDTSRKGNMRCG